MKKILLIVVLLSACAEETFKPRRAMVMDVTELDNGKCSYHIEPIVPFIAPEFRTLEDVCGKYSVGQTLFF